MKTLSELETMSNDELRLVLAELDGYALVPWQGEDFFYFQPTEQERVLARDGQMTGALRWYALPNYPEDLNACHEAEKGLTPRQWPRYVRMLSGLTRDRSGERLTFATARQRTIALILTLQQP